MKLKGNFAIISIIQEHPDWDDEMVAEK